jgi:type IV secretory system conjugative DNA transfer VirD4/TraG family protein/uncharacterized protein DUF87
VDRIMKLTEIETIIELQLIQFLRYTIRFEHDYSYYIGIAFGVLLMLFWLVENLYTRVVFFLGLVVVFMSQPGLYLLLPELSQKLLNRAYFIDKEHLYYFIAGSVVSAIVTLLVVQLIERIKDRLKHLLSSSTPFGRGISSDIRSIAKYMPNIIGVFNPLKYFSKKGEVFFGKTGSKVNHYISLEQWRSSHCQITGTTGCGKGVLAGSLLYQSCLKGEAIVVLDPKNDEWLPHVLANAAKQAGVDFFYIDLTDVVPQWNPMAGCSSLQAEEIFSAAFDLAEKGTDADFYRLNDREFARRASYELAGKSENFREWAEQFIIDNSDITEKAPKFKSDLLELSSLPVTHTNKGLDLRKAIEAGAVVYVRGSMRNSRVIKLQRALLMALIHACEERERNNARHVCLFVDELKFSLSPQFKESISTCRDKHLHMILAYQALGDLKDCPASMNPDAIVSTVNINCSLKVSYKTNDPETAEWLSRLSGTILVDEEVREFDTTRALAEVKGESRKLRQGERALIDSNMLLSLPPRCAILFGDGLAKFIFTAPVVVEKDNKWITPTVFDSFTSSNHSVIKTEFSNLNEGLIDVD